MNNSFFPLAVLTMAEVGKRIKLRDSEATKKWCVTNNIPLHKISKKDCVYQIDLEYTIGIPFVSDLKKKHPQSWTCLLKDILGNDALYNYFLCKLGEPRNDKGFSSVQLLNDKEKELYKNLIS